MSAGEINWRDEVAQYAARGPDQEAAVRAAKLQAGELDGDEFWEAVLTLAQQAVAMQGAAEETS